MKVFKNKSKAFASESKKEEALSRARYWSNGAGHSAGAIVEHIHDAFCAVKPEYNPEYMCKLTMPVGLQLWFTASEELPIYGFYIESQREQL